ncbi:hypothetical protein FACS189441_4570 [Betaproteobacteria bacterium]|nr:hypothetical protein FACS189441_4570 [Betaproteobacteria bacterium]
MLKPGQVIPVRIRNETRRLPEDSAIARQGEVDKVSFLMRIGITRWGGNTEHKVWCGLNVHNAPIAWRTWQMQ